MIEDLKNDNFEITHDMDEKRCKSRTRIRRFWQLLKMCILKVGVEKEMSRFERHHQEKISQENQLYQL